MFRVAALAGGLGLFGCYQGAGAASGGEMPPGEAGTGATDGDASGGATDADTDDPPPGEDAADFGPMAMVRLTRAEYGGCIQDVLGVEVSLDDLNSLPDAEPSPFDNDATSQSSSATLVGGYERLARAVSETVVQDAARLDALAPCPGGDTAACHEDAIAAVGRRLLRRPLTADEVELFAGLAPASEGYAGSFRIALAALLQDAEFLFRVEVGEPIEGEPELRRLTDLELASRLSFLLWGVGPDDDLLDEAEREEVHTTQQLSTAAERMLDEPKAVARVQRFFSLWLGYNVLPHEPGLADAIRLESDRLVKRVFDDRVAWQEVLVSTDTFLTPALAEHYGMPAPGNGQGAWVDYADSPRGGLLSHGSFLALGAKFGDTSPVVRGLQVRQKLLCLDIAPPPPDLEVDVDSPPPGDAECKVDLYRPMVEDANCAVCHLQLNPVGFGLERFDAMGRYRTEEPDNPACTIAAEGELPGHGTFSGPAELGALLAESELAQRCLGTQLLRYWLARADITSESSLAEEFAVDLQDAGGDLHKIILEFVARESFLYRQLPAE